MNTTNEPFLFDQHLFKTNEFDISLEHHRDDLNPENDDFQIPFLDVSFFPVDVDEEMDELLETDELLEDFQPKLTCSADPSSNSESKLETTIESSISDTTNPSVLGNCLNTVYSTTPSLVNRFHWSVSSPSFVQTEKTHAFRQHVKNLNDQQQQTLKPFHEMKWYKSFKEFVAYQKENGHGAVPHTYPKNPQLASWVKRQRRQYKLRQEGQPSTMTRKRLDLLNSVDFMWDSHEVNWRERLHALKQFSRVHGHCNVPVNHKEQKLGMWVKCQRRQYKLYKEGKKSAINPERIFELNQMGFEWEMCRGVSRRNTRFTTK